MRGRKIQRLDFARSYRMEKSDITFAENAFSRRPPTQGRVHVGQ